jgi:hypothetical protein
MDSSKQKPNRLGHIMLSRVTISNHLLTHIRLDNYGCLSYAMFVCASAFELLKKLADN